MLHLLSSPASPPLTKEQLAAARQLHTELGHSVFADLVEQLGKEFAGTSVDQTTAVVRPTVTRATVPNREAPRKDDCLGRQADHNSRKRPRIHDAFESEIAPAIIRSKIECKRKEFDPHLCPGTFSSGGQIACENDSSPFKYKKRWMKHFDKWDLESYQLVAPQQKKKYRCVYGCERLFQEGTSLTEHIWKDHMLTSISPQHQKQSLPNPVPPLVDTVAPQSVPLLTDKALHGIQRSLVATDKGEDQAALAMKAGPTANIMPASATPASIAASAWTDDASRTLLCGLLLPPSSMHPISSFAMFQQDPVTSSLTSGEFLNSGDLEIHTSDLDFDIDTQSFSFDDPLQAFGFDPIASIKLDP